MIKINESNVTVLVKDMDRAVKFYESIGLRIKNRWGDHYAQMAAADIIIGLHPGGENIPANEKISIGFMIDDIKEAEKLLDEKKIAHKEKEDGKSGIYVHFSDPDGTALYFTQPKWK